MSNKSTFNNNKKGYKKNCTVRGCTTNQENSSESFRAGGKAEDFPSKKRTNERVRDDLSSFIAEFSYLTDAQDSKQEACKTSIPSYDAHLVGYDSKKNYTNRRSNLEPYTNNGYRRRKSVEWLDQKYSYPDRSTNEHYSREAPSVEYSEGDKRPEILKKERDVDLVCDHRRRRSRRNQISIRKSQDGNKFYKRPTSKLEKCKCFDAVEDEKLKSPDRKSVTRFRAESSENNRIRSHHKVRRKKSKSHVRYWPFRYKHKKSKHRSERHPHVKKKNYVALERKEEITSESPTVVTIYPKKPDEKLCRGTPNEVEFLANPELPCKCFECMKKFESLQNIFSHEPETSYNKPKNSFQSMPTGDGILNHPRTLSHQPKKCPCQKPQRETYNAPGQQHQPPDFGQIERNLYKEVVPKTMAPTTDCANPICYSLNHKRKQNPWLYNCYKCPQMKACCPMPPCHQPLLPDCVPGNWCRTGYCYDSEPSLTNYRIKPCPYPCDYENMLSEVSLDECDEQNGGQFYKSVYFRFNCVGHQIDPAVTQYFHSILNNRIE